MEVRKPHIKSIPYDEFKDNKTLENIANELNEKYGLNITKTKDASSFKKTENAPKAKGLFSFLFN